MAEETTTPETTTPETTTPEAPVEELKAYDFDKLLDAWKTSVPELVEETAVVMVKDLFNWLTESAVISKTPVDDILSAAYPLAQATALKYVDQIDGEDDAGR